jgi:5-methyltetrahydrofolate--homocysteine methyltransferase
LNNKKIDFSKFLLFDGAMGTMLHQHGIKPGELPEGYNMSHPEIIHQIHTAYLAAGADIITTNTFGANRLKLKDSGYSVSDIVGDGVKIAKASAGDKLVALDIGPVGQLMQPYGTLSFQDAYDVVAEQVKVGAACGADLILIETLSDLYEAKAAVLAAKENSQLPVICSMTFQADGRTLTGTDPVTMVNVLQGLGVDALGLNCSLGPKEIMPLVEEILKYAKVPVIVQANAGLPKYQDGKTVFGIMPDEFADYAVEMAKAGVIILGGCCGTTPEYIKAVKKSLQGLVPRKNQAVGISAVSSPTKTVIMGQGVKIIGERINPTGKKKIKEALKNNDLDYLIQEAIGQRDAGAHILDVNAGLPEIDEKAMMVNIIRELQSVVELPLQIDSVRGDVIEAAVRIYNGKPIINSVNGKKKVMEEIFPIAKKYGACLVCLTLDDNGIPEKAEERLAIAENMIKTAESYGIPKEDLIVDCLVLTASAQQEAVKETIKAVGLVKQKFGVATTLGVSNVSFGLPRRELLNRTFLAAAMGAGLDTPIMNPMDEEIMGVIYAYNVLWANDKDSRDYINKYSGVVLETKTSADIAEKDLIKIICDGIREEAAAKTKELLKTMDGLAIVDGFLIPALDLVGQQYERGQIFLPQLIQSAETVKKAFDVIREVLPKDSKGHINKGKVILATVRGDIHDIGKNIVKVLLQNYGYEVIDLGKDVPIESVVESAITNQVKLVGLSALMTTTVKSMEETIQALKDQHPNCLVMVGGAVLNPEYAAMIGADFYAKDARESVRIAQSIFEGRYKEK